MYSCRNDCYQHYSLEKLCVSSSASFIAKCKQHARCASKASKKLVALRARRRFEAQQQGQLISKDQQLSPAQLARKIDKQAESDKAQAENKERKRQRSITDPGFELQGKLVFLSQRLDHKTNVDCQAQLTKRGAVLTNSMSRAEVFVVDSIADPGQRVAWRIRLFSLAVISTQWLLTGNGPWLQLATLTKKTIWWTRAFAQEHVVLVKILEEAVQRCGSVWQKKPRDPNPQLDNKQIVILTTLAEKDGPCT